MKRQPDFDAAELLSLVTTLGFVFAFYGFIYVAIKVGFWVVRVTGEMIR